MTSTKDIYWLAGLLEGEGSFRIMQHRYPRISLKMNDRDVVEHALRIVKPALFIKPGFHLQSRTDPRRLGSRSAFVSIDVNGIKAVGWMMTLYPLMGQRRQTQIRAALQAWRFRRNLLIKRKIARTRVREDRQGARVRYPGSCVRNGQRSGT